MRIFIAILIGVLALGSSGLKSQFPGRTTKSPIETLREMKTINDAIIERQNATIKSLEGLKGTSEQIKIFSKRS